eukprot:gnl/TRDRNA2_/TRDRNA2_134392_c1_seq1.p1 gnl/TRDRNA2_/TRDRNA2_134392_c1~~gnl/TRDRNA2_/TRDRNA2_134392_c1_seq1.p1  ORF type:complete len:110 (+),score=22.52 gnl/TRDRNA2_/TRDRNA2_134392_c1_seq1:51-332(+)
MFVDAGYRECCVKSWLGEELWCYKCDTKLPFLYDWNLTLEDAAQRRVAGYSNIISIPFATLLSLLADSLLMVLVLRIRLGHSSTRENAPLLAT